MTTWSVPGFTELRLLGAGATGRVVLARRDGTGELVAIKYLAQGLLADMAFAERFRREAQLMALVRDPNVVRIHELVTAPDGAGVALVMEAVEGPTLRAMLSRGHGSPEAALALLRGSLLGLAAAHDRGIVHRDYKPDNVLVDAGGHSKLTDFGIAAPAGEGVPAEGTPAYMPPEQWNGHPASPASDMYAAAVTFYECLTGVRPFQADTAAELRTLHQAAHVPLDAIPEPVRELLQRGLAKDPRQRYADVRAFVADVEATAVAGYGRDWLEHATVGLAAAAGAMISALPLLAAGTSGTVAAAGGAATGGAAGSGSAVGGAAAHGAAAQAAGQGAGAGAGAGASAGAVHGVGGAAGHGAAHSAAHGAASAQAATTGLHHAQQVAGTAGRGAWWARRGGSTLLHGKGLVATVATGAVIGATVTVVSVQSGAPSHDHKVSAASAGTPAASPISTVTVASGPSSRLAPACLSESDALAAANKLNPLPADAKLRPGSLTCDADWAMASVDSSSIGSARVVYQAQNGAWKAVVLGTDLCGDPQGAAQLAPAPASIRQALRCPAGPASGTPATAGAPGSGATPPQGKALTSSELAAALLTDADLHASGWKVDSERSSTPRATADDMACQPLADLFDLGDGLAKPVVSAHRGYLPTDGRTRPDIADDLEQYRPGDAEIVLKNARNTLALCPSFTARTMGIDAKFTVTEVGAPVLGDDSLAVTITVELPAGPASTGSGVFVATGSTLVALTITTSGGDTLPAQLVQKQLDKVKAAIGI